MNFCLCLAIEINGNARDFYEVIVDQGEVLVKSEINDQIFKKMKFLSIFFKKKFQGRLLFRYSLPTKIARRVTGQIAACALAY